MEKAYKFRIYPNKEQRIQIAKTFGCVRFVFNYYLDKRKTSYEQNGISLNYYDDAKDLPKLKNELAWLKEVDSSALQSSIKSLDVAYKNFFNHTANFPKFKSKKTHKFSYKSVFTNNNIEYLGKFIKLPKLGHVKTRNKLVPRGRIVSATVAQEPSGKYFVSLCCTDVENSQFEKTQTNIGIDLGLKDFAILSDGTKVKNPKYLKQSLTKLARLQRELFRKTRGGSNWNKQRIKVAKLFEYIKNQRKDFLQKLTTSLVKNYDIICIEDLNIERMLDNSKLAKNISDASWFEFRRLLEYKTKWYGKQLSIVDTFYASSQTCHYCGSVDSITRDLSVRFWTCPNCNASLDRDVNSAINILNEGLRLLVV